ncbi:hypothetical protein Q1695_003951 [Nippostrongylus brasiliensis]|nr:hypothetical protein Q1695_003951 [Nippostrongylus brasiliensis]
MAGRHDKVMPETDESGSGSEVSIEDEEDGKGSDGDESDDTEEESESSEEEESSESDSSESDGESSSDDSDSTDSLWDAFDDGDKKETQEANEASALQEFQRALDCLVKGKNAVASKILKRLLENPLVKGFNTTVFDWEAEFDERLSKMARLFVGIHKNLAKLESEDSSNHFLQILSVAPKNAEIWLSLGLERIASGDLDFGKFAIEHAEGPAATDALLSALYLSRNFHACLRLAQKCLSTGVAREKALFLKEKIRSLNDHYREFSDKIFGENRRYDDVETLDEATTKKIAQRLFAVEERLREIQQTEEEISIPLPIDIEFDAEQTVQDVATCFCDLFDRIEAYSSLSLQEITFSRWDDRRDLLESSAIIEQMLDVVETVDSLVSQVSCESGKRRERRTSASASMMSAHESFLRRSMRYAMELPFLEESPPMESPERCRLDGNLPPVELAKFLGFRPRYIVPLKEELIKRPSRTPSPELHPDYIDADMLLYLLMTTLKGGSWVMFDLMEAFLCLVADMSPAFGAIPPELREVIVQCYRRFNRMSSNLCEERYIRLHVLMDELGEAHARDYCIRWHYEERWTDRELLQRFILSHAKAITDENIKLAFLRHLYESLEDDEFVFTAKGWASKEDIRGSIDRLERSNRIISISQLRSSGRYDEADFHSMEDDDLFEMAGFLLEAYIKVENYDAAVDFASRLLHLLLSYKQVPEEKLFSVVESIKEVKWKRVEKDVAERMGYFLCQLVSIDSFTAEWQVWKELYRVAEHIGGGVSVEYIHSLDPLKQDEAMPSLGLDVLLKAHEKLGEAKKCGKDKGAFLLFFMEKLHDCIANEAVVAVLRRDDFSWLWSNVSEEISQCLYCMFGRYSKRRRALEDHECSVSHVDLAKYSTMVVELAMPHPMPQYDDKDRLGHDVVDLLFNKFPTMLKYSEDRKNVMNDFTKWMREASKNGQANLLKWPTVKGESYVQACVWYLMALHHFRLNNYNETETYSKLFLTSGHATLESRLAAGAWAVLAYTTVFRLFQMDDDLLYLEWPWHVIPFRISLLVDSHIGVVYFQLANTLYQIGTRLSRYFLTVPSDDWHLLHSESLLLDLRKESLMLFEEALSRASHTETGGICEFQWLCYFFLAKLQAKLDPTDVVKIVDGMFEAACSCELSLFFYPIKINVKKQQNIEPVELHYQIHATVWKYLCETPSPPLKTLVTLVAYLRAMQYHKVVRSNLSLFSYHPDLHDALVQLTIDCDHRDSDEIEEVVDDLVTRVDLMEELWNLCHRGFELVCERFPHMKSYYRLAEMELSKGNVEAAYGHLIKHVFRRKKRDDSLFDSVVEITSQDIDRSGSFPYHVDRTLQLTMKLAYKLKDMSTLLCIITSLVSNIESRSEEFILKERQGALLQHAVGRLHILMMESATPKQLRFDLYRAWQAVVRCKTLAVRSAHNRLKKLIEHVFGSVDAFVAEHVVLEDHKKKQARKRKLTTYDLVAEDNSAEKGNASGEALNIASASSDPLKLMRLAYNV